MSGIVLHHLKVRSIYLAEFSRSSNTYPREQEAFCKMAEQSLRPDFFWHYVRVLVDFREDMSGLRSRVESCKSASPALPLAHSCDAYFFVQIATLAELSASDCSVYLGEQLLYFFYGKPSYRTQSAGSNAVSLSAFWPVCVLVDSVTPTPPKRVFPFDSGAYSHGLFSDFLHPAMELNDFEIGKSIDSASRCVSLLFGNNKDYLDGLLNSDKTPSGEFEEEVLRAMISSKKSSPEDDRRSSIELQFDQNIPLNSDSVKFVVLPSALLDNSEIQSKIMEWGCDFHGYRCHRANPLEFVQLISQAVDEFLKKENYV
ncbi:hypothetical protein N9Z02_01450 [Akkermansiaceae bacterium]|nr:hypothetical protein [Akkermansiaceae bacterium]